MARKTCLMRQILIILLVGVTLFALFRYYNTSEGFQDKKEYIFEVIAERTGNVKFNGINPEKGPTVTGGSDGKFSISNLGNQGTFLRDIKIEYLKNNNNFSEILSTLGKLVYGLGQGPRIRMQGKNKDIIKPGFPSNNEQLPLPPNMRYPNGIPLTEINSKIDFLNVKGTNIPGDIKPNVNNIRVTLTFT